MFRVSLAVALATIAILPPSTHGQDLDAPPAPAEATTLTTAEAPDLSGFDRDTLAAICTQLYGRVAELEAQVAELQARIGGEHGGTTASVDDDTAAIPDGAWVVTITANLVPDTRAIESELEEARRVLNPRGFNTLAYRIDAARNRLTAMEAAKTTYYNTAGDRRRKDAYSSKDLDTARAAVRELENEQRAAQLKVRQLEQRLAAASRERQISAMTDDGKPCTLIVRGAYMHLADTLFEQQRYTVTGRGTFGATTGRIVVKAAAPAVDAPVQ